MLIVIVVAALTDVAGGLLAGAGSVPLLEVLAQLTYGFLDATLP